MLWKISGCLDTRTQQVDSLPLLYTRKRAPIGARFLSRSINEQVPWQYGLLSYDNIASNSIIDRIKANQVSS